jgi:GTP cyclohydrolase III
LNTYQVMSRSRVTGTTVVTTVFGKNPDDACVRAKNSLKQEGVSEQEYERDWVVTSLRQLANVA